MQTALMHWQEAENRSSSDRGIDGLPSNGLAFSCRERAADHLSKSARSRARSGQLQCRVGPLLAMCVVLPHLQHFMAHQYILGQSNQAIET